MDKRKVDKIAAQALNEIQHARIFKQGKVPTWQKNEEMYYAKKIKSGESRANVALGRMQEFVHTLLSKIDNPLDFKYRKRKNAQLQRVELLNALRTADKDKDNWDIKDIVGKKQAIIYGRAIYEYFATSEGGYCAHLIPVDVYDFLVDPNCGGMDLEEARYMGSWNVQLDKRSLKEGKKNKIFIGSAVDLLVNEGTGNDGEASQEQTNKTQRMYDQKTIGQKSDYDPTKYRFWKWVTTFQDDGLRYYLLINNSGTVLRCVPLTDISPATPDFPLGPFPYWSWASFPDLTEFWTPSQCDYVREVFMAQDVSVNQMLDNAEAINKPQKIVNVNAFDDLNTLKYRRDGIIPYKSERSPQEVVQFVQVPSINTPIQVFNLLEQIQEKASGVTAGAKGVADEEGKVGIYEGNQAATADRFGLLNKSYAFGYKRFAKLYELGVRYNLTKKVAVDIVGPEGVEVKEVSRRDIFRKNEEFSVLVEASNAETLTSIQDKTAKMNFLNTQVQNTNVNQKKLTEMQAKIAGFTEDDVSELMDVSYYGNSRLMAECDRDIEKILDGDDIKPNEMANNAYRQKLLNFTRDNEENITFDQFTRLTKYFDLLEPIVMRNEARAVQGQVNDMVKQNMGKENGETVIGESISPDAEVPEGQPNEQTDIETFNQ